MAETTFEEAKRCPKCKQPGEDRKTTIAKGMPRGTTVHHIYCVTTLCPWFNTPWMVQVNADGSVPPATNHTGVQKSYEGFKGHDAEALALMDELKKSMQRQQEPGYEIRRNR